MLDNRINFKLPLYVQTYINTHSSSSLPCAPKTRKVRRSRNTSRCSAQGSNSSSIAALSTPSINTNRTKLAYTQKKPWDQFTLNTYEQHESTWVSAAEEEERDYYHTILIRGPVLPSFPRCHLRREPRCGN